VGLPEGGQRRARGLRREDVAELSGVSLAWYARFELGQLASVSDRVIEAVSTALRLDETERNYLQALARPLHTAPQPEDAAIPAMLRFVVESYTAGPAALLGARLDLLVINDIARTLELGFDDAGLLSNLAWLAFVDPATRDRFLDGDQRRREIAAMLRFSYARHVGDRAYDDLIAAVTEASPEFARAWESFEVKPLEFNDLQLAAGGEVVTFSTIVLTTNAAPGHSVVLMRPGDPAQFERIIAQLPRVERAGPRSPTERSSRR
jgi:transcriptional regulator with XRE-family HTH domain